MEKKIIDLVKKSLKTKSKISTNSNNSNISEWDSLGHLSILTSLDKITKGKSANLKSLSDAYSVKKILSILKKNKISL